MQLWLRSAFMMPLDNAFVSVILLAGGKGTRMRSSIPKQYLPLGGKPLALYSLELFAACKAISEIIIVCDLFYQPLFMPHHTSLLFATPGNRRQDSVYSGLQKTSNPSKKTHLICVHDSARPLAAPSDLMNVLAEAKKHGAAAAANLVKNTIKECDPQGFVQSTLDRSQLWEMYTPQVVEASLLKRGFKIALENNLTVTDDAALVELTGHPVKLVQGSYSNIKITTPEDLPLAETLLRLQ